MSTSGGIAYHESGFAGLQESKQPTSGLLHDQVNITPGRESKVANFVYESLVERPFSVPGSLFLKKLHASTDS